MFILHFVTHAHPGKIIKRRVKQTVENKAAQKAYR